MAHAWLYKDQVCMHSLINIDWISSRAALPWRDSLSLRVTECSLSYQDYLSTQLHIPYVRGPCKTHREESKETEQMQLPKNSPRQLTLVFECRHHQSAQNSVCQNKNSPVKMELYTSNHSLTSDTARRYRHCHLKGARRSLKHGQPCKTQRSGFK